ncbi:MAG TPA: hypothetical protein DCZ75_02515 [Geobacter sp.]|nr:hypothetical protein [Geobacter sp.]
MKERYVIDTNVLIAASAIEANSPIAKDATPEDPELRKIVNDWLYEFDTSTSRLVLDGEGQIHDEYCNKLGFNDYGRQVVIHKWSTCNYDQVEVVYDDENCGYLEEPLSSVVHDRSDRKMVAAALEAIKCYGECAIANAADTDWYDWEEALRASGIFVEQIIDEWAKDKWLEKSHHA